MNETPADPHRVRLRPADARDRPVLEEALCHAADPAGPARLSVADVYADPALARYVDGWPRAGDRGIVAEAPPGVPVGAAWVRTGSLQDPGYGFVAPGVPELSMAVAPAYRGTGWGASLLDALLVELRAGGVPSLSLSVREDNAVARGLYEARGFVAVGRSGASATMLLVL